MRGVSTRVRWFSYLWGGDLPYSGQSLSLFLYPRNKARDKRRSTNQSEVRKEKIQFWVKSFQGPGLRTDARSWSLAVNTSKVQR